MSGNLIFLESTLGLVFEGTCKNYPGFNCFFLPPLKEPTKVSKFWEKKFQPVFKVPILLRFRTNGFQR
jgi:hypothetical protein